MRKMTGKMMLIQTTKLNLKGTRKILRVHRNLPHSLVHNRGQPRGRVVSPVAGSKPKPVRPNN